MKLPSLPGFQFAWEMSRSDQDLVVTGGEEAGQLHHDEFGKRSRSKGMRCCIKLRQVACAVRCKVMRSWLCLGVFADLQICSLLMQS